MKKKIGLLGGIGPESSAGFYLDLINQFQKVYKPKTNTDFPQIILNSIPAPELIYDKVTKKILDVYVKQLAFLEEAGCNFIAIICNTAYSFLPYFQSKVSVPIIDLPKEVKSALLKRKARIITRLVTPTALKHNVYKFDGFIYNELTTKEINILEQAIANFNVGKEKNKQIKIVKKIYNKYKVKSDTVIIGCSELALMLKDNENDEKLFDPLRILALSTLKQYVS